MATKDGVFELRTYDQQAEKMAAAIAKSKSADAQSMARLADVVVHNARDLASKVLAATTPGTPVSRQAHHPSELPPHLKEAVRDARMGPEHDHLNRFTDEN